MKNKTVLLVFLLFLSTGIGMIWHIKALQTSLAEQAAIANAKLIGISVSESHHLLARQNIISSSPEILSLELGNSISTQLIKKSKVLLYSPFPFNKRLAESGLNNEFKKEAWSKILANPLQPFYQFHESSGRKQLKYAVAELMKKDCVNCHNTHPLSTKTDWQVGDVAGVVEVALPVAKILPKENQNLRMTVLAYSAVIFCGFLGVILMIIKTKHFDDELNRLTTTDPLTGLFNQSELMTSLKREINKVKRGGEALCLLYFDIVGFKQINDTIGRLKGDELLRVIGRELPEHVRAFDIPCRISGDEFAVILPKCTLDAAAHIGERIVDSLQDKYPDIELRIGISQSSTEKLLDSDELVKQAIANKKGQSSPTNE